MSVLFDIFFGFFVWFTMGFISKAVWDNYTDWKKWDDGDGYQFLVFFTFLFAPIIFALAMAYVFGNGTYKWFGGKQNEIGKKK